MSKRRPSGDGMVRKRDDGRWEGRAVIGYDDKGLPITKVERFELPHRGTSGGAAGSPC